MQVLAAEVLPPARLKFVADLVAVHQKDFSLAFNVPDVGDGSSRNAGRHTLPRWSGKEQFVILSAMQREFEIHFARWPPHARPRNQFRLNLRPDATLFANMR